MPVVSVVMVSAVVGVIIAEGIAVGGGSSAAGVCDGVPAGVPPENDRGGDGDGKRAMRLSR